MGAHETDRPTTAESPAVTDQTLQFALMGFEGESAAAQSFAAACEHCGSVPWLREVGVVEHHRNGRLVLRGTFAGHYVDVDENDHVSEIGAGRGALVRGLVGAVLGPPGIAVGLVLGTVVGSQTGAPSEVEPEPQPLSDRLRDAVPPSSSALLLIAGPLEIDEMLEAVGATATATGVTRGTLAAHVQAELDAALASAPAVPLANRA